MSYSCKILADSLNTAGNRLTSFEVTYPRIILAEVNTHRMLSKSTASSRAIPVAKMIAAVKSDPFVPVWFGKNQPGMKADEQLDPEAIEECKKIWLEGLDKAVDSVEKLLTLGLHKQVTNRLLENWMWTTSIITGTEWGNFFGLRAHPDAQPEFQVLAKMMKESYNSNKPKLMQAGEWHLPYMPDLEDLKKDFKEMDLVKISAGRCARTSYTSQNGVRDPKEDIELCDRLVVAGHMSPCDHPAKAYPPSWDYMTMYKDTGNFKGWLQYRKTMPFESDFSKRPTV